MNICIVAATMEEIKPFIQRHGIMESRTKRVHHHELEYLITGVGITSMVYYLLHHVLFRRSDFYILAGIGGAMHKNIEIGETVEVFSDLFADLGTESAAGNFLTLDDMGLNTDPGLQWFTTNSFALNLKKVAGITVHQVLGKQERIDKVNSMFQADVLSMDGAAFSYVMRKKNIPAMQVRSISHYVGNSKKEHWNLPLAIQNLDAFLEFFIDEPAFRHMR